MVRVCIAVCFLLAGCAVRTSGLKPESNPDGGRDGAAIDARMDARIPDAGTDACLGCECRTAADCSPRRTEHTDCMVAAPTGPCDQNGTRQRIEITYLCNAGSCREDRNAVGEACTVPTDGMSCGATTYGPWSACTTSGCATSGTQTRVAMDAVCMGGTCGATSRMESQSCSAETDGDICRGSLDCRGRCSGGSCDRVSCGGDSDCNGLCASGFRYCVAGCCLCA